MWIELPDDDKDAYKHAILCFTNMTELFSQKAKNKASLIPYISSKFQETMFIRSFGAVMEDISNTPFDASLKIEKEGEVEKYLIGIKTFEFKKGFQKIAQFKNNLGEWSELISIIEKNSKDDSGKRLDIKTINERNMENYMNLAKQISHVRNLRMSLSLTKLYGLKVDNDDAVKRVYHVLMPAVVKDDPVIMVGEASYDEINIGELKIEGCCRCNNPANFVFSDNNHRYRFTASDCQLWMDFNDDDIVIEKWNVTYPDDPFSILGIADLQQRKMVVHDGVSVQTYFDILPRITESYTWSLLNSKGEVEKYSGFNSFFGTGSKIPKNKRELTIESIRLKYAKTVERKILEKIIPLLQDYLLKSSRKEKDRDYKVGIRNDIERLLDSSGNREFIEHIRKIIYRPFNEMYIPIPDSKSFHNMHPDFFGTGNAEFIPGTDKFKKTPEERKFNLIFEPSGDVITAFLTQSNAKGISSFKKQSTLGHLIRTRVFQLEKYQPLTAERLEELEINAIKIFKVEGSDDVYLEFIWDENLN